MIDLPRRNNSVQMLLARAFRFGLAAVLALILIPCAAAQTASLTGMVTDPSGAAVEGAAITVRNVNTGATRKSVTGGAGWYEVLSLAVGDYEVIVRKKGFAEALRKGIHIAVGQDATADVSLRVGNIRQHVTVNADADAVSLATADISGLVGRRQVDGLPLNGRSYDELLTLNPGIVNFTS